MADRRVRSGSPELWSHNVHYHWVILGAIPPGCVRALDVGCGQGLLTRRLRCVVPEVTGVDKDERSISIARAHPDASGIGYVQGDFLAMPFEPASLDLVTAVASLHHMDAEAALRRMEELLRPGGVLVIVGLAKERSLADFCLAVPAVIGNWLHRATSAWGGRRSAAGAVAAHTSPIIWPPPLTYRQTRRLAGRVLPGATYHRHLYWRFSLVWIKPS